MVNNDGSNDIHGFVMFNYMTGSHIWSVPLTTRSIPSLFLQCQHAWLLPGQIRICWCSWRSRSNCFACSVANSTNPLVGNSWCVVAIIFMQWCHWPSKKTSVSRFPTKDACWLICTWDQVVPLNLQHLRPKPTMIFFNKTIFLAATFNQGQPLTHGVHDPQRPSGERSKEHSSTAFGR